MFINLKICSLFGLIVNNLNALSITEESESDDEYRLPNTTIPKHYKIDLTVEEDAIYTDIFFGKVTITLNVIETTNEIKLHYKYIKVTEVELKKDNTIINTNLYKYNLETNLFTIKCTKNLAIGIYYLKISYEGSLLPISYSKYGFYKSSYTENGTVNYVFSTKLEPTSAREAFPCFDEPGFKAVFDISITFPQEYNALGNTEIINEEYVGNLKRVTFQTTPKMSTYLVALVVSKMSCDSLHTLDNIPVSVCSRNDSQNSRKLALSTVPKILEIMKNFTGYSYSDSKMNKVTLVALPALRSNAVENWGLITFKERSLLWHPQESSNSHKEKIVVVIGHELAHQWFGNLVTLEWWSHVFLNEAFGVYFGYYVADQIWPEWELNKKFTFERLHVALFEDSVFSIPLSSYAETTQMIKFKFDTMSYYKGPSILRMINHFLGAENFRSGLRDYISENKFSNVNPSILWNTLEKYSLDLPEPQKLPNNMSTVMKNWIYYTGYPLLTVNLNGSDIIISQEPFQLFNKTSHSIIKWYVPITYTVKNGNFSDTTTKAWLTPYEDLTIRNVLSNETDEEWIILNNQQIGYYRINYDNELWRRISKSLNKPNFDNIDELSRAQIVNDLFNLAQANKKSFLELFELLSFLKNDTSYYPWRTAFIHFIRIFRQTENREERKCLKIYFSKLVESLYASTTFGEERPKDHMYTAKKELALEWACELENEDCVTTSIKLFSEYKEKRIKPNRNLRNIVYCYGVRYSDNFTDDLSFLQGKITETVVANEQSDLLEAIDCAKRYVDWRHKN